MSPSSVLELPLTGIRADDRTPRNAAVLSEMHGCKPTPYGASTYVPLTAAFSSAVLSAASITISHPFPQLFHGRDYTLLVTATKIYTVNTSNWTITEIPAASIFDIATTGSELTPNGDFALGTPPNPTDWTLGGLTWDDTNEWLASDGLALDYARITGAIFTTKVYRVTYTLTIDHTHANATVGAGAYCQFGTVVGTTHYNGGTFTEDVTSDSTTFRLYAQQGCVATFDDVSIKEVPANAITTGNAWHFADMGNMWFLANDNCLVFRDPGSARVYCTDSIRPRSVAAHRGRIAYAGLQSFTNSAWQTGFDTLRNYSSVAMTYYQNEVWWSSIGAGDALWQFFPWRAFDLDDQGDTLYRDFLERNEFGSMPMKWQGPIYKILELGEGFGVYGQDGVSFLRRVAEPMPTFGLIETTLPGVSGKNSVGGTTEEHIIVDTAGNLWRVKADFSIKRLGYREYFSAYNTGDVTMAFDPEEREHYISNGTDSYILTSAGAASIPEMVTSAISWNGSFRGVIEATGDNEIRLISNDYDFGSRGAKTVYGFEIQTDNPTDFSVRIEYRNAGSDSYTATGYTTFSADGVANIVVTAVEFKFTIKAAAYGSKMIESARVLWRVGEKGGYGVY